jgi:ferredoxin
MRRRLRDGSGAGGCRSRAVGAAGTGSGTAAVAVVPAPASDGPVGAPAVSSRARTVAILVRPESCLGCGACVEACPRSAITLEETAVIDARTCTGCSFCVDACPQDALGLRVV